jgi:transcriptional regulator with XRE-family HTH domain
MLDYSAIGRNLAELRNKSGKTQMELAKLLNVSHQAVSKWERGQALPGIESFLILSELYRLTINELVSPDRRQIDQAAPADQQWTDSGEMSSIWPELLKHFRSKLSKPSFDTWFKETTAEFNENSVTVYSPTAFANEWLSIRYSSSIAEAIRELTGNSDLKLCFRSRCQGTPA